MANYLLSIVIPSKNRSEYAIKCIESLLSFNSVNLEIVVVDNSDDDILEIWVKNHVNNPCVVYFRVREYLSVVENFQTGIDLSTGEYVCTIGDDDGVNPEIIELALWASNKGIDAITPRFIADYQWPDLRGNNKSKSVNSGSLKIRKFSNSIIYKNVEQGFHKLARSSGTDLSDSFYLPKLYYGIVKREILIEVKRRIGTNFPGVSPDLSGAVAAANFVKTYVVLDYPIFVPGSSLKSTAGQSALRNHHGDLYAQKHISKSAVDMWPVKIPKFFAVETVWGQSSYMALTLLERHDVLKAFNFARIYAYSLVFNRDYYKYVWIALKNKVEVDNSNLWFELFNILYEFVLLWLRRGKYLLKRFRSKIQNKTITIGGLETIADASLALTQYLKSNSISLKTVLIDE